MALALAALAAGVWAGLLRLGWPLPAPGESFGALHGPLMIGGFLGTLIGIERAVALGSAWAYAAPVLSAAGVVTLLADPALAPLLLTGAAALLTATCIAIAMAQPALFTATMALGALAWLVGNATWLAGAAVPQLVTWWVLFLVLTIAGERLELSRLMPRTRTAERTFVAVVVLLLAGAAGGGITSRPGAWLTGLAFVALTVWLARYDVARRTIRQTGLPRFTAWCLLSGYGWLAVAGLIAVCGGVLVDTKAYDAFLHAVLLGFVFAMIFGHAPIIFPAVLGVPIPFRGSFYLHLLLLHFSVALRLEGDAVGYDPPRAWGGLFSALAVLLFLGNTVRAAVAARRGLSPPRGSVV
jgi:hypothetical protein